MSTNSYLPPLNFRIAASKMINKLSDSELNALMRIKPNTTILDTAIQECPGNSIDATNLCQAS